MTKANELANLGQSVWLDYIRRNFLENSGLKDMVAQGIRGVTSNPSIFEKAIGGSDDYDEQLADLIRDGKTTDEIYEALAIADIQMAADILKPVYDETNGLDGYVSLEVSPTLAYKTDETIADARRLHAMVNRPNVMIKVPATPQGIPAIKTLISEGININVTLIFSLEQYEGVMEAYLSGLESLAANDGDLSHVASVASFFISRVDSAVDNALEEIGNTDLKGKIAIANAAVAYARFNEIFSGERWEKLASNGATVQRPLWASTSTKDPSYPDTLYVDTLIGPHTVNTMPTNTLEAFLDHGTAERTLTDDGADAKALLDSLDETSISLDEITDKLLAEGVDKFAASFDALMTSIEEKQAKLTQSQTEFEFTLGEFQSAAEVAFKDLQDHNVMQRIWSHDHTVWKDDPTEITNRLGWLRIMDVVKGSLDRINRLVESAKSDGFTHALLLGMGGSSLAPEVFRKTFGVAKGYLDLAILDSTDPGRVLEYDETLDPAKTLFIVATKSGGTAETLSFFKYFYNRTANVVGKEKAGEHFVAITDPGSKLEKIADQYQFRSTFLNDPNIGGRYSALSFFGIVPAALIGVDVAMILDRASTMALNCSATNSPSQGDNLGGQIGAIMGELAKAGRDKITLIASESVTSFGDWVEQLIAESTGKEGKGILPVVGEATSAPDAYGDDRLFVYLRLNGESEQDQAINALKSAGHPVITLNLQDRYDIGGQYFLWEVATAVSGQRLAINPFDQPNVESAKVLAREMITTYNETGELPTLQPTLSDNGITVYGDVKANSAAGALSTFISQATSGDYISIHAYIHPTEEADAALSKLQTTLRDTSKLATTVGYGPRFLHSTGQLHKGDGGNGLFIQILADMPQDAPIPDEAGDDASAMSFGTLKTAQALGDRQALLDNNRRVIRCDLSGSFTDTINKLMSDL